MTNIFFYELKPFYTKITSSKVRLVFAYHYLKVQIDDVWYFFIPTNGTELVVDLNTKQITNLTDIFVFQNGYIIRGYDLKTLCEKSNLLDVLHNYLDSIIRVESPEEIGTDDLLLSLQIKNLSEQIDIALERNDKEHFELLTLELHKLTKGLPLDFFKSEGAPL